MLLLRFLAMTSHIGILVGCLVGCSDSVRDYPSAVRSGFSKIPAAQQIEELFPGSDHFISSHGEWNSESFIAERYVLTMQVDIDVSEHFDEVLDIREQPRFYLWEIASVDTISKGQFQANGEGGIEFGAEQWKGAVNSQVQLGRMPWKTSWGVR